MRLKNLEIKNFRSIEALSLAFPSYYSAISGKNNSGKSNLLRVLKFLFEREPRFRFRQEELSYSENFPVWKAKDSAETIKFRCELQISRASDSSVFKLAQQFFDFGDEVSESTLEITAEYRGGNEPSELVITHLGRTLDTYRSATLMKQIRSSGAFQFHNSTEMDDPFGGRSGIADLIGDIAKTDRDKLIRDRDKFAKTVSAVAKKHQKEISELLGRLEDKYVVGLTGPNLNVDLLPIDITLGDRKIGVSLEEWGSGTQNRTHILMSLFRARKLSESLNEDTKIAPILVVEEPESFLHPSAQAEFGRLVQLMSEELQIQVIVATHSPYFLSQLTPESNVLLERKLKGGRLAETVRIEVEADNWMEPFARNLGLANAEFEPWKGVIFSETTQILMVEGTSDKEYFELLRDPKHGSNKLNFEGEIFPYEGTGNINNGLLLKFVMGRYSRCFITFDLDHEKILGKVLEGLGCEKNKHYVAIGKPGKGTDRMEGLLPAEVKRTVNADHVDLVDQLQSAVTDERNDARSRLKKLYLEEFKRTAVPGETFYGEFYKLVKIINRAMC